MFLFCVQDPVVEGLPAKVVVAGGKQRTPVREYLPGEKKYRMVYMEPHWHYPGNQQPQLRADLFGWGIPVMATLRITDVTHPNHPFHCLFTIVRNFD